VGVCKAGGREDGAALDAGLQTLFFQGEALEVREGEAVGGALVGMLDGMLLGGWVMGLGRHVRRSQYPSAPVHQPHCD